MASVLAIGAEMETWDAGHTVQRVSFPEPPAVSPDSLTFAPGVRSTRACQRTFARGRGNDSIHTTEVLIS